MPGRRIGGRDLGTFEKISIGKKNPALLLAVGMEFSISEGDHEKLMDIAGFDISFAASGKGKHNLIVLVQAVILV